MNVAHGDHRACAAWPNRDRVEERGQVEGAAEVDDTVGQIAWHPGACGVGLLPDQYDPGRADPAGQCPICPLRAMRSGRQFTTIVSGAGIIRRFRNSSMFISVDSGSFAANTLANAMRPRSVT